MSINFLDQPLYSSGLLYKKKTLDELEKDEQFLEVSERFLQSVGENSDDVFEYLRDSDFNLYSGMRRAAQSANFTDQQKQDYNYLRKEFDNADLGSLKQFFGLVKDAAIDITTDPTAIVAALATPLTGGASLAARQGVATAGLQVAKNFVGPTIPKSIIAGQLKKEGKEAVKKAALITGAEVGVWTGLDNHFRQTTELNTGIRKLYSTPELAGTAALGTLTGGLLGGALQKGNLFYSKMNRLYSEDGYLTLEPGSFQDKVSKTLEVGDRVKAMTIGSATSILDTKAKFSPITRELGNLMREDFSRGFGGLTRERVALGHGELLENLRGEYHSVFDEATAPLRKAGAFKEADELGVIRILRGDKPEGYSEDVQQVAKDLRGFFDKIFDDAIEAGLIKEERKLPNYFTRSWDRKAIEENRESFADLLISENVVKDKADAADLINDMLNKNNELFSSHSILLTQSRAFKDLNDNAFEKFLTNDLNTVVTYYMNAANAIQHKKSFLLPGFSTKSNENQFIARWLDPMDRELREARGGRGLSRGDRKRTIKLYKSITGQVNYFDSQRIQGAYDTMKLANSLAYLPLATVSSLTESMIPLTKTSGSVTKPVQDALRGVREGHKIFVQDIPILLRKKYDMPDSQIQKEMNQVFMAMDESLAESTNRLTGEGLQNEWLKKQARGFFRLNLLTPWTKSVQLASFNIGKNLIKENLEKLNKLSKEGVDIFNETATKELSRKEVRNIQLLKSEVFDLGIDIDDGLRWLNSGAKTGFGAERKDGVLTGQIKYEDEFYKSIIQGAGRFVNEVIMPVGRNRARIPIFMTNPKVDILTQFLRYPAVFSNTVLKNYIRSAVNNPTVNGAKLGAFGLMATSLALGTNYWRSNEDNRDRIVEEGFEDEDFIKAFQRVGLFGPLEYGLRFKNSIQYTKNPLVSALSLGGPTVTDTLGLILGRKGLVETAAGKTPFIGTKGIMNKYIGANPYDDLNIFAKEIDKEAAYALGIKDRPKDRKYTRNYTDFYRSNYATGGEVQDEYPVQFVKKDPKDRESDDLGGMSYAEQMDRLGFALGGLGKLVGKEIVESISKPKPLTQTELNTMPLKYSQKKILEEENFKGIEAMHGTPSDFDKFSTEFLMSGEGAMAFGKGLYFTTTEEIAKGYKKNISKSQGIKKLTQEYEDLIGQAENAKKAGNNKERQAFLLKAIDKDKELETFKTTPLPDDVGNLYKVNLKTTDNHLLDWDKKMEYQPSGVVSAAETAIDSLDNMQLEEFITLYGKYPSWTKDRDREQLVSDAWVTMSELTGEDFISGINKLINKGNTADRKYVEDMLEKSGVVGIKYNDGFTRKTKGKKKKNYVVFDARIIEISKKYGIAIPAAGALLKKVDDEAQSGNVLSDEQMDRLGFNIGGVLARQLIKRSLPASKPVQQKILKDTSDISKAEIQDKALLTEYKKNVDDMWELEQKGLGDEIEKLYERQGALEEQMQEVGDFYQKEYTHTQNFDVNNPSVYRTGEYKLVKIDRDPYYTGSEDVVYKLNPEKYTEEEVKNQIIKLLDENLLIKDDQHIDVKTLIKAASNNSPRDATILKTLDKNGMLWIDSPGGYYKEKLYGAAKTLYAKGDKYPTKSGKNMLPFERLAREGVGNDTFRVGTDSKPFFVNPNKLDNLINFSSSNKDYFRHRLEFNREQFLKELTNLKDRIIERGYFGKGTNSSPIQIEVSRFGDVIIPEGNHRLALALISKQEEVPIILYYKQGAERLKTNLSIDNLSSLLDKGKTGYKTNKEFGILKRKVNKQFKNVEVYTDEYVKKQGYSLGGKVSTNEQMDRLGFKDGEEVETKPLLQRILQSVERASPEEEKEFLKEHPYYGEVIGNKVYINEQKLRNEGSTGNYVEDMFFGEALHKLKESSPKWYDRLYSAANKDPDVMRWRDEAYEREVEGGYKGTKQQHWDESRFDQVVGGFLLGRPDANIHTMRGWDRNALPYGTHFRKELEDFEKELGRNPEK